MLRASLRNRLTGMPSVSDIFLAAAQAPAVHTLARRVEPGGVVPIAGVDSAAWGWLAAALRVHFPRQPIVLVTAALKVQEQLQQDVDTWLGWGGGGRALFYADWEVLPHEDKLPHADAISDRLETLLALAEGGPPPVISTTVAALMQATL